MDVKTTRNTARDRIAKSAVARRGFTLVEMLTVIIIISILAGLVVVAAGPAIRRAREFTIRQEIAQLAMALEKYKQEHGDYPPDFAGVDNGTGSGVLETGARDAVLRHFRKAFPRYRPGACGYLLPAPDTPYRRFLSDINYATRTQQSDGTVNGYETGIDVANIDLTPAAALVLMLGGPPAPKVESSRLLGFSANPANPFARGGSRLSTLYEFDETQIQVNYHEDEDNYAPISWPILIPPHAAPSCGDQIVPYVYFRARSNGYIRNDGTGWLGGDRYANDSPAIPSFDPPGGCDCVCTPYAASSEQDPVSGNFIFHWKSPKTFQIICSGLDGEFGEGPDAGAGEGTVRVLDGDDANISPEEDDNITSFTEGKLADRAEE